ncbi:MAG: hypothetical protein FD123_3034 [Bacteroidetes bacterium]|nr:MAG: hypothetical protein FD123_3034 [Bacteroidota bacterium]
MKKLLLFLFPAMICLESAAQHFQFTQFYAAPMHLNPAFTGDNVCSRVSTSYRDQWPSVTGKFVTYAVSYDTYLNTVNSGFGFMVMNDRSGSGNLQALSVSGLYSYEVTLTKYWFARAGLQASYVARSININNLLFGDQIARGGNVTTIETAPEIRSYFDVSTGALVYSQKYWFGFAAHHITSPDQALTTNGESGLPTEFSVHMGGKFPLDNMAPFKSTVFITPAFHYKAQHKFDQVDIGFYYTNKPLVLGLWYRGIPGFKAYVPGYANNDAISALIGLTIERLKVGYSYDLTISRLVNRTGGSHEISLGYEFCKLKKKKKKPILISCPKF